MIRPSSLLLLLLVLAGMLSMALWRQATPPVGGRPVTIISPAPAAPQPALAPVTAPADLPPLMANPLLAVAPSKATTDDEKQIELLQGQVEYLSDQVKALQQENSDLIDRLAKLGIKDGGPMKGEPAPMAAPDDFVGLGEELLSLRELQALPMPTVAVPQTQVQDVILAWLRRQYPGDFGQREGAAFAALGAIPQPIDTLPLKAGLMARQIGGWYDDQAETIFMVDPADKPDGLPVQSDPVLGLAYATLLHQYQKALLPATAAALTTDERQARFGLLGGDAGLIRFLRDLKQFKGPNPDAIPVDDPDHPLNLVPLPAYLRELELFPAVHGFSFAQALHSIGGFAQVGAAYGRTPDSTADVLDPQRYVDEQRLPVPRIEWKTTEVQGAKPFWDDRLGQYATLVFLKRYNDTQAAIDATRGWQSDRFAAYAAGTGSSQRGHAVWETRWITSEQAALFAKAIKECLKQFYDVPNADQPFTAQGRHVSCLHTAGSPSVLMIDAATKDFAEAAAAGR